MSNGSYKVWKMNKWKDIRYWCVILLDDLLQIKDNFPNEAFVEYGPFTKDLAPISDVCLKSVYFELPWRFSVILKS